MTRRRNLDLPAPGPSQPDEAPAKQPTPVSTPETPTGSDDQTISVLFGLSTVEFGIYRRMVARPSMTDTEVTEAAAELGANPAEWRAVLDRLRQLGLVTAYPDDPTRHVATPPTTALDAMVAARSRGLARVRRQMHHLASRYHHRRDEDDALVEVVRGPAAIGRLMNDLGQTARHEIVFFHAPPYLARGLGNIFPGDPPRHDLPFRVIYDPRTFEATPHRRADVAGQVHNADQQVRVAAAPMKLAVADGRIAFIPLDRDTSPSEAVLLIREPRLVAVLSALFEAYWARAVPLHLRAGDTTRREATGLSDSDLELLVLLVAGYTDRAIAAQLGWTDRTVRRRTSTMMRLLGAETRFQAGYQAVAQGWVSPHERDNRTADEDRA